MFPETVTAAFGYYILWVGYHDRHVVLLIGWFTYFLTSFHEFSRTN